MTGIRKDRLGVGSILSYTASALALGFIMTIFSYSVFIRVTASVLLLVVLQSLPFYPLLHHSIAMPKRRHLFIFAILAWTIGSMAGLWYSITFAGYSIPVFQEGIESGFERLSREIDFYLMFPVSVLTNGIAALMSAALATDMSFLILSGRGSGFLLAVVLSALYWWMTGYSILLLRRLLGAKGCPRTGLILWGGIILLVLWILVIIST